MMKKLTPWVAVFLSVCVASSPACAAGILGSAMGPAAQSAGDSSPLFKLQALTPAAVQAVFHPSLDVPLSALVQSRAAQQRWRAHRPWRHAQAATLAVACALSAACQSPTSPSPTPGGSAGVLFRDDFSGSSVDGAWTIPTGIATSFYGRTQIRPTQSVVFENGLARLRLDTHNPSAQRPGDSFWGAEIQTRRTFAVNNGISFGARARLPAGTPPGLVGGIFGYALLGAGFSRDELDFELLSNDLTFNRVITNLFTNEGFGSAGRWEYVPGIDLTQFHDYLIEWYPDRVVWKIDGRRVREIQTVIPTEPMSFRLNFWAPASGFWQAYNGTLQPASTSGGNRSYYFEVDWAEVRSLGSSLETGSRTLQEQISPLRWLQKGVLVLLAVALTGMLLRALGRLLKRMSKLEIAPMDWSRVFSGGLVPAGAALGPSGRQPMEIFDPRGLQSQDTSIRQQPIPFDLRASTPKHEGKNAYEWFLHAQSLGEKSDFPGVVAAYRQALSLKPELFVSAASGKKTPLSAYIFDGLYLVGEYCVAAGDRATAVLAFATIVDKDSSAGSLNRIKALEFLARLELVSGQLPQAATRYLELERLIQGKVFVPIGLRFEILLHAGMVRSMLHPADTRPSLRLYNEALQFLLMLYHKQHPKKELSQTLYSDFVARFEEWESRLFSSMTTLYYYIGISHFIIHEIPEAVQNLKTALSSEFLDERSRENAQWYYSFGLYRSGQWEEAIQESRQLKGAASRDALAAMAQARVHLSRAWNPKSGTLDTKELSEGFRQTVVGLVSGLAKIGITVPEGSRVLQFNQAVSALRSSKTKEKLEAMEMGERIFFTELLLSASELAALLGMHALAASGAEAAHELNSQDMLIQKVDLVRTGIAALGSEDPAAWEAFHRVLGMINDQVAAEAQEFIDALEHKRLARRQRTAPPRNLLLGRSA